MLFLISIILELFIIFHCKNIVLSFGKLTIGNFNGLNNIDDLINYNIYTNISIGTPPQIVAHFIDPTDYSFHFQKKILTYGNYKSIPYLSKYENMRNFWFQEKNSSTFSRNNTTGFCTDIYYLNNLKNEKIETSNLKYTILDTHLRDAYKCGIIGLNNPVKFDFKLNKNEAYFIDELKENGLISEYTFSVFYNEKNTLFDTKNDIYYGIIIIGESPHIFYPEKYTNEDLITYQSSDWSLLTNSVYFKSSKFDFLQEKIEIQISFISGFIKGTESYRIQIEDIFFNELIKKNLCKVEIFKENIYLTDFLVFSCDNNYEVEDYIKSFPNLYFELPNNLEFIFTYNDLFQIHNNRFYFMIIFKIEGILAFSPKWIMGDIFLRKYLALFNYETREISFYRNQVEKTNKKSIKICVYDFSMIKKIKILCGIILGLIIIIIFFLLYRRNVKSRKINANELEKKPSLDDKKINKEEILLS